VDKFHSAQHIRLWSGLNFHTPGAEPVDPANKASGLMVVGRVSSSGVASAFQSRGKISAPGSSRAARGVGKNKQSTKSFHMENAAKISTYRVWGLDSVVYGAVDLPGLIQWIRDERVKADQWIFAEHDNRWQKAADLPELQATLRSKPPAGVTGADPVSKGGRSLGVKPDALRRMKVFAGLDDRQVESFVRYMERIQCPQFSHIVRKGEHGDAMYIVLEGELRALAMVDGKESALATIAVGETFGEISLIDQGPRSSDVVANRDSVLLKFSSVAFDQLLREAPALAVPFLMALSRSVVGRVRGLTKRYEDSVHFIRTTHAAR